MPTERRLAVVTGASSGIGRAFAEQLAALGHDLVIVARSRERLEALAVELGERNGSEVQIFVADLNNDKSVTDLAGLLHSRVPDLLVNSAGFGAFGRFEELDLDRQVELLRVNVQALVCLTYACLPGMLKRGSGAVVNVSSLAGEAPIAYNAIYGASKSCVTSFSRALYEELRDTAITVQCLLPGLTATPWAEAAGVDTANVPRMAISDPDDVVRASLAALRRGSAECVPGAANRILALVQRTMPRLLSRTIASATRKNMPGRILRGPG